MPAAHSTLHLRVSDAANDEERVEDLLERPQVSRSGLLPDLLSRPEIGGKEAPFLARETPCLTWRRVPAAPEPARPSTTDSGDEEHPYSEDREAVHLASFLDAEVAHLPFGEQ